MVTIMKLRRVCQTRPIQTIRRHFMNSYEILIPFHSNKVLLEYCIESLLKTTPDAVPITIIANNEDSDAIDIHFLQKRIRIIKIDHSLYYPLCVNYGMQYIKSPYVILIDADTYHLNGWFEALTHIAETEESIGIIGSALLETTTSAIKDYGLGFSGYNWVQIYKGQKINSPLIQNRSFQAVCTASCLINRQAFIEIGGFSEYCNISYSDIDLCIRLAQNGYKVKGCSESRAYHKGNASQRIVPLLKKDCYAMFMAKIYPFMTTDMDSFLFVSSQSYCGKLPSKYIFLDFSSIINAEWYKGQIESLLGIDIAETYRYPSNTRDKESINLVSAIQTDIYRNHYSFIYFVDWFIALKNNQMWQDLRSPNIQGDLVVDRHGTVCRLEEIDNL